MISTPRNNPRMTRSVVGVWLALLSVAQVMLVVTLPWTDAQLEQRVPDAQIADLQTRALELEGFRASVDSAPAMVTESDFQRFSNLWQQQWDNLNQRQLDLTTAAELAAVQHGLDAPAQQVSTTIPVATNPRPRVTKTKSVATTPTFQLLGVETRGGERFLAIQPSDTTGLNAVRLLRIGESDGGWQLEALEPKNALFRINQQTRRLPLPQE